MPVHAEDVPTNITRIEAGNEDAYIYSWAPRAGGRVDLVTMRAKRTPDRLLTARVREFGDVRPFIVAAEAALAALEDEPPLEGSFLSRSKQTAVAAAQAASFNWRDSVKSQGRPYALNDYIHLLQCLLNRNELGAGTPLADSAFSIGGMELPKRIGGGRLILDLPEKSWRLEGASNIGLTRSGKLEAPWPEESVLQAVRRQIFDHGYRRDIEGLYLVCLAKAARALDRHPDFNHFEDAAQEASVLAEKGKHWRKRSKSSPIHGETPDMMRLTRLRMQRSF